MFSGIFAAPNPADWIASIKDDAQKRQLISVGVSMAYSSYITTLYELGASLKGGKWLGWLATPFLKLAASAFVLLQLQDTQKMIYLSIPSELVNDKALLDTIWWEKKTS